MSFKFKSSRPKGKVTAKSTVKREISFMKSKLRKPAKIKVMKSHAPKIKGMRFKLNDKYL